jgi:RimJ/RimL family protein N-acetyltransferase
VRYEPLEPRHAALVFGELQDPRMYTYIPDEPPASIDVLAARYARLAAGGPRGERWYNWLALDGDAPVALLQATLYDDRRASVAWIVFPRVWRRGYGTRAATWLLAELAELGAQLAEATIDPRNTASLALAAKLGFTRVGTDGDDIVLSRAIISG